MMVRLVAGSLPIEKDLPVMQQRIQTAPTFAALSLPLRLAEHQRFAHRVSPRCSLLPTTKLAHAAATSAASIPALFSLRFIVP